MWAIASRPTCWPGVRGRDGPHRAARERQLTTLPQPWCARSCVPAWPRILVHRFGLAPVAAERAWAPGDPPECAADLRRIAVLDPAVGSGAFLLGAWRAHTPAPRRGRRTRRHGTPRRSWRLPLGVDLNLTAVRPRRATSVARPRAGPGEPHSPARPRCRPRRACEPGDALLDPSALARSLAGCRGNHGPSAEVERLPRRAARSSASRTGPSGGARRARRCRGSPAREPCSRRPSRPSTARRRAGRRGQGSRPVRDGGGGSARTSARCSGACARVAASFGRRRAASPVRVAPPSLPSNPFAGHLARGGSTSSPGTRPGSAASGCRQVREAGNPLCHRGGPARGPGFAHCPTSRLRSWSARSSFAAPRGAAATACPREARVERLCGAAATGGSPQAGLESGGSDRRSWVRSVPRSNPWPCGRAGRADRAASGATALGPKTGARRSPSAPSRSTVRGSFAGGAARDSCVTCEPSVRRWRSLEPAVPV